MSSDPSVVALAVGPTGSTDLFKHGKDCIRLNVDNGVGGDRHAGRPDRQVSLLQSEYLAELNDMSNASDPIEMSELGENITTKGLSLANLKRGTKLCFVDSIDGNGDGNSAVVELTGLRRAGEKLENRQKGLKEKCIVRDTSGTEVGSKVGVFGVVIVSGAVKRGMSIIVEKPTGEGEPEPLKFI